MTGMKRRLRDTLSLDCPVPEADSRIAAYLAGHRDRDGVTRFDLKVPLDGIAPVQGLALEKEVRVDARRDKDDQNLNDLVRIAWKADDGAFPAFEGTLVTFGAEGDPAHSFVELDGWYEPPFGDAGEIFDETVGHSIAERTARALLDDIAEASAVG
jgi:hypothetical protein